MDETGIKDERLQRLIKAARNAGGTIESDMLEVMRDSDTEHDFEVSWFYRLRNELNRVCGFYNVLADRLHEEKRR
jgi:hypothetical protein